MSKIAKTNKVRLDYNCGFMIDAGYLPLIGLPKKRVDFNPRKSIIQPLAVHDIDDSWRNLEAEITRRKGGSCTKERADDVRSNSPNTTSGTMARIQRRFKKALVRLRQVFMADAGGRTEETKETKNEQDNTRPPSRMLVRRDSNASSAKRLAAKRRRMNLNEMEALVEAECNKRPDRLDDDNAENPEAGQITNELAEIFEHLSITIRKRPRLTTNSFGTPAETDSVPVEPS